MENLTVLSAKISGQAAVFKVVQSSGVLGGLLLLKLEVTSITAGGRPLYVIDGVPMNDGY
jgi:hypothetical protein